MNWITRGDVRNVATMGLPTPSLLVIVLVMVPVYFLVTNWYVVLPTALALAAVVGIAYAVMRQTDGPRPPRQQAKVKTVRLASGELVVVE